MLALRNIRFYLGIWVLFLETFCQRTHGLTGKSYAFLIFYLSYHKLERDCERVSCFQIYPSHL